MSGSLSHPEPANTFSLWTPTCPLHRGRTPGGSDLKIRSAALGKTHPHGQAFLIYHPNVAVSLSFADYSGLNRLWAKLDPVWICSNSLCSAWFLCLLQNVSEDSHTAITQINNFTIRTGRNFPFWEQDKAKSINVQQRDEQLSQEYFNRIYQSSICIFKLVCTSWSRTTWNQFFKNPSEAERSHCHFLDLEECCFESPIQNLNTGLRSLHFLLSFMCRLAMA